MAGKAESIEAYDGAGDVLTPYTNVPTCEVGEFSARGVNPVVADQSAQTYTETPEAFGGSVPK